MLFWVWNVAMSTETVTLSPVLGWCNGIRTSWKNSLNIDVCLFAGEHPAAMQHSNAGARPELFTYSVLSTFLIFMWSQHSFMWLWEGKGWTALILLPLREGWLMKRWKGEWPLALSSSASATAIHISMKAALPALLIHDSHHLSHLKSPLILSFEVVSNGNESYALEILYIPFWNIPGESLLWCSTNPVGL